MRIKLLFTRRRNFYSRLICLLTRSSWSHVELIVEREGYAPRVIGAKAGGGAPANKGIGGVLGGGVVEALVSTRVDQSSKAAIMTISGISPGMIITWARAHIGTGYDWPGVLGLLFGRRVEDPEKFFCSEFIATAFAKSNHPLFSEGVEWRVTPQDIWEIGGMGAYLITRESVK